MAFDDNNSGDMFSPSGGQPVAFDLNKLLVTLQKFYWILPITTLIGLGLAYAFVKTSKPNFRSTAEIKIERRGAGPSAASMMEATTPEDLKTIEQSFISPMLMRRVIAAKGLDKLNDFVERGRLASSVSEPELVGYLMGKSKVALIPDTRLANISFENWNAKWAEEIANAIVQEGVEYDRTQRYESLSGNVQYLKDEAANLESKLKVAEENLNDDLKKMGVSSIDEEINVETSQLRDLNSRYTSAKTDRLNLESQYDQIEACRKDPEKLMDIESIRKVPAVERLYLRAGELRGQLVKLAQRYRPANPLVVQTQTELKEVEATLKQEILQAPNTIGVALAASRGNEESVAREKKAQEDRVIRINGLLIPAQVKKRQIDADRLSYQATLARLNDELAQARSQPVLLQIVDPAGPAFKTSVSSMKVLFMGLVGGVAVGGGLIFLLMQLDSTIRTTEDAESAFRTSVLALVPAYEKHEEGEELSSKSRSRRNRELALPDLEHSPLQADPHSRAAEAFRALRASIQIVEETAQDSNVLVTSAVPGEGKSFCALNLAVAMAHSGQRTLLVDSQLRKPVMEERIFGARGGMGLSDYLQGTAGFSSVIRSSPIPSLDVVTAGSPSTQPAEILSRQRLHEFLSEAQRHYDRVIFDASAITPVSDTLGFARFFSVVCLVVRSESTPRRDINRAIALLERAGAKPYGVVLNFAVPKFSLESRSKDDASFSDVEDVEELDFPKSCKKCGRVYENFDDYIRRTKAPEETTASKSPEARRALEFHRICQCGAPVVVQSENRRDLTAKGLRRRQAFGELQERLIDAGMPREEARGQLLLTLKIWRSELMGDHQLDNSEAGKRRSQLFDTVLDRLVRSGLSEEQAKARLLETIQIWRDAP
ncbi:hypothetical protein BH09VER1_BH09VER1_52570 [soil metagenome]